MLVPSLVVAVIDDAFPATAAAVLAVLLVLVGASVVPALGGVAAANAVGGVALLHHAPVSRSDHPESVMVEWLALLEIILRKDLLVTLGIPNPLVVAETVPVG